VGNRCADHVTPLYPQKLALTSPTGGGRSVGIVRVRTKATEYAYRAYGVKPLSCRLLKYSTINDIFASGTFISRYGIFRH